MLIVVDYDPVLNSPFSLKLKSESWSVVSDSLWPHGWYSPWKSPGQYTGVGSLSPLQQIFPTQGLNSGFPHGRRILYLLSHKGSPRILGWVTYPFSTKSSQPRSRARVFWIAGGFLTNWTIREAHRHGQKLNVCCDNNRAWQTFIRIIVLSACIF